MMQGIEKLEGSHFELKLEEGSGELIEEKQHKDPEPEFIPDIHALIQNYYNRIKESPLTKEDMLLLKSKLGILTDSRNFCVEHNMLIVEALTLANKLMAYSAAKNEELQSLIGELEILENLVDTQYLEPILDHACNINNTGTYLCSLGYFLANLITKNKANQERYFPYICAQEKFCMYLIYIPDCLVYLLIFVYNTIVKHHLLYYQFVTTKEGRNLLKNIFEGVVRHQECSSYPKIHEWFTMLYKHIFQQEIKEERKVAKAKERYRKRKMTPPPQGGTRSVISAAEAFQTPRTPQGAKSSRSPTCIEDTLPGTPPALQILLNSLAQTPREQDSSFVGEYSLLHYLTEPPNPPFFLKILKTYSIAKSVSEYTGINLGEFMFIFPLQETFLSLLMEEWIADIEDHLERTGGRLNVLDIMGINSLKYIGVLMYNLLECYQQYHDTKLLDIIWKQGTNEHQKLPPNLLLFQKFHTTHIKALRSLVDLLGSISEGSHCQKRVQNLLIETIMDSCFMLLHRIDKIYEWVKSKPKTHSASSLHGLQAAVMRIISNLSFQNEKAVDFFLQDTKRLADILAHTRLDERECTLREWSLFTIRHLCEGSRLIINALQNLQMVGVEVDNEMKDTFNKLGLIVKLDPNGNKVKIVHVDKSKIINKQ